MNFKPARLLIFAASLSLSVGLRAGEPSVRVSEVTLHTNMECFKIETPSATYLYGKRGAGFASILDREGHDWISYSPAVQALGEYRGLPKCGQPIKYFHCGYGFGQYTNNNWFTSTVTAREPGHVRIHSETHNNDSACDWDFFPTHATMTLLRIGHTNYWFIYEGTPGGTLDVADDFVILPGGKKKPLSEPWMQVVPWVVFGAKESKSGLLLLNHQHNSPVDSYVSWPYKPDKTGALNQMTVFGFGRLGWTDPKQHQPQLHGLPAKLTISLLDSAETARVQPAVERLQQELKLK